MCDTGGDGDFGHECYDDVSIAMMTRTHDYEYGGDFSHSSVIKLCFTPFTCDSRVMSWRRLSRSSVPKCVPDSAE